MKKIILAAICITFAQHTLATNDVIYEISCQKRTDTEHLKLTKKDSVITALYATTFGGKAAADWYMRATEQTFIDPDHTSALLVTIPSMNTWNTMDTLLDGSKTTIVFQDASSMTIHITNDDYTVKYTAEITNVADLAKTFNALVQIEKNRPAGCADDLEKAFPELCTRVQKTKSSELAQLLELQKN